MDPNHNTEAAGVHEEAPATPPYAQRVLLTSLVIVGMGFSVLFPLLGFIRDQLL